MKYLILVFFLLLFSPIQNLRASYFDGIPEFVFPGAIHVLKLSFRPTCPLCSSCLSENNEASMDRQPVPESMLTSCPGFDTPTTGSTSSNQQGGCTSPSAPPPISSGEHRFTRNGHEEDDPDPPQPTQQVCCSCQNRWVRPGERYCGHCLVINEEQESRGASLPACVHCKQQRDGQLLDNHWVCSFCATPESRLTGDTGLCSRHKSIYFRDNEGVLQHRTIAGLTNHPDRIAQQVAQCHECCESIQTTEAVSRTADSHLPSPTCDWVIVFDPQRDTLIKDLNLTELINLISHYASMLKADGYEATHEYIYKLLVRHPSLTKKEAYHYLIPFFADTKKQNKCSIQ